MKDQFSQQQGQSWLSQNLFMVLGGVLFVLFFLFAMGGGYNDATPLEQTRMALKKTPTYSVILQDVKEEGNFFKNYYQKLNVVLPGSGLDPKDTATKESSAVPFAEPKVEETGWLETTEDDYKALLPFVGMTIFKKKDGKETDEASTPGYEYVGDERYGHWQRSSSGLMFWAWAAPYAFWGSRYGTSPISQSNYNTYTKNRKQGKPYLAPPPPPAGTPGKNASSSSFANKHSKMSSGTSSQQSSFAKRHAAMQTSSSSRKVGRNSVAVRSRSSSVGK